MVDQSMEKYFELVVDDTADNLCVVLAWARHSDGTWKKQRPTIVGLIEEEDNPTSLYPSITEFNEQWEKDMRYKKGLMPYPSYGGLLKFAEDRGFHAGEWAIGVCSLNCIMEEVIDPEHI